MDTIYSYYKIKNIDLVKLDIEGNELMSLKGMGKFLKKTKIIQFEFGQANIDSRTFFRDLFSFFKKNNFIIYRITPAKLKVIDNWTGNMEHFRVTNYLAVNSNIKLS